MSGPIITISVDYQFPTQKYAFNCSTNNSNLLRAYLTRDKEKFQPDANYTAKLAYCATGYQSNTAPATIDGTVSTTDNYAEFELTNIINSNSASTFYSQVVLFNNSAGNNLQYVMGDGTINVLKSPLANIGA